MFNQARPPAALMGPRGGGAPPPPPGESYESGYGGGGWGSGKPPSLMQQNVPPPSWSGRGGSGGGSWNQPPPPPGTTGPPARGSAPPPPPGEKEAVSLFQTRSSYLNCSSFRSKWLREPGRIGLLLSSAVLRRTPTLVVGLRRGVWRKWIRPSAVRGRVERSSASPAKLGMGRASSAATTRYRVTHVVAENLPSI